MRKLLLYKSVRTCTCTCYIYSPSNRDGTLTQTFPGSTTRLVQQSINNARPPPPPPPTLKLNCCGLHFAATRRRAVTAPGRLLQVSTRLVAIITVAWARQVYSAVFRLGIHAPWVGRNPRTAAPFPALGFGLGGQRQKNSSYLERVRSPDLLVTKPALFNVYVPKTRLAE